MGWDLVGGLSLAALFCPGFSSCHQRTKKMLLAGRLGKIDRQIDPIYRFLLRAARQVGPAARGPS